MRPAAPPRPGRGRQGTIGLLKHGPSGADTGDMSVARDRPETAPGSPFGVGAAGRADVGSAPARVVRARFLGDAVGWAFGAVMVLLLGVVGVAGYRLVAHQESVAAPLPELSAEAAGWLAGQQEVAVYRGGQVFLYGTVSSEAEKQAMIDMAVRALGAGNVVADEYFVDPTSAPRSGPTTMRVADPVLFEFNSTTIAPGFEPVLDFVATVMQQNPSLGIVVVGHTDDVGDDNDNLRLSQERAEAGMAAIIARGGDPTRITREGRGETNPLAPNDTEDGRRMNRRVEFVLSGI